jgi:large subunit ribosomal protein L29
MALLRTKEIRAMDAAARDKKLRELRDELMHERGVAAMGGAPPNPGKIRALRKNIARIYTIQAMEGGAAATPAAATPPEASKPGKAPSRAKAEPEEADELDVELDDEPEEDKA